MVDNVNPDATDPAEEVINRRLMGAHGKAKGWG